MMQFEVLQAALRRAGAASRFIQGEVLEIADACVVLADASAPLSLESLEVARASEVTSGLIVVPHAVDQVVLITQTCDLQETTAEECFCLVTPVRLVERRIAHEAWRGRRPALAGLPWADDQSVADLARITTIERSVLLGAPSLGRPRTPRERLQFAEAVSRYLTRPALPDAINTVLSPLVRRIGEKHDRNSAEGRCANRVSEMRVEAAPDLDHAEPALNVLMILEEKYLPKLAAGQQVDDDRIDELRRNGPQASAEAVEAATQPIAVREAWTALAECWVQPAATLVPDVPGVGSVDVSVLNAEELSYARSLNAPILDIRYLSTRTT